MLNVTRIPAFADNYLWLLRRANSSAAVAVDPGDAAAIIAPLEAHHWHLSDILLTHHHRDHIGGVAELKTRYDCRIWGPAQETIADVDVTLHGNEVISVGDLGDLQVLSVPGHTRGHIAYCIGDALFSGDVLFGAGCGRLFEGTAAQQWQSLQRLSSMRDSTDVYCAHEYTLANLRFAVSIEPDNPDLLVRLEQVQHRRQRGEATVPLNLGEEKRTNPFLRGHEKALQQRVAVLTGRPIDNALMCFTELRRLKDQFKA